MLRRGAIAETNPLMWLSLQQLKADGRERRRRQQCSGGKQVGIKHWGGGVEESMEGGEEHGGVGLSTEEGGREHGGR